MKINLKNAKELQKLYGWGSSACWWSQAINDDKTARDVANLLYGDDGLRLNIYRYNIGGGTDESNYRVQNPWRRTESFMSYDRETEEITWDYTKDKNAIRVMDYALETGNVDTLILFCNSPHYSQCSTGQASGSLIPHTCNLPKMNYKKFADYVLDVTQHFLDEGYPVKYISPINEPQWKWGGSYVWQEGCHYETEELVEVLRTFAEEIIKRDMPVKLYTPETGAMLEFTPEYIEAIAKDELIMQVTDIFAYHSYHSDDKPSERYKFKKEIVEKYPQFRFDMSEWCELPNKSHTKNFKGALITARIIGQDIINAGAESWTSWVGVNQYAIKDDGFDYSDATITATTEFDEYYIAKRYWGFAHYSKYIPVGSVALDIGLHPTEDENTLNASAFKTPSGEAVLVIVNEGNDATIDIECECDTMQIIRSSQDEELVEIYNGVTLDKIESKENTILTVIMK